MRGVLAISEAATLAPCIPAGTHGNNVRHPLGSRRLAQTDDRADGFNVFGG
jgi:hypothetical protein